MRRCAGSPARDLRRRRWHDTVTIEGAALRSAPTDQETFAREEHREAESRASCRGSRHHDHGGCAAGNGRGQEPYKIYLSNNFVGNDWRQQMERVAEVSVEQGAARGPRRPQDRECRGHRPGADQLAEQHHPRRSRTPSSSTPPPTRRSNPTIKKACDAGIVVISFDQVVTEPCALRGRLELGAHPRASWPNGWPCSSAARATCCSTAALPARRSRAQLQQGYEKVLANYPDIKVVGYYNGKYALGPEQAGVAALLAANPKVDGIMTQGYGSGAIQALKDAGRPMVPVVGFSYNVAALTCVQTQAPSASSARTRPISRRKPSSSRSTSSTPARSRRSGRSRSRATSSPPTPFESKLFPGTKMQTIEVGENAFPDQAPGLTLPITPDWVDITAAEAAGTK